MNKFRLYFDVDKETEWLNEMAKNGYAMTGFAAGFYRFDTCEPGKYEYQIDFSDKFFSVSNSYREFMNEMDIEIVQCWGPWVYLRKETDGTEFKLYTDVDSMIEHYTKIRNLFKIVTIIELVCFFIELIAALNGFGAGVLFSIIIGILVIAFGSAAIRTNRIVLELKERKGEISHSNAMKKGKISPALIAGLMLNCVGQTLNLSSVSEYLVGIVIGLAIIFMIIGIIQTMASMRQ